jgi:hypothetical protein
MTGDIKEYQGKWRSHVFRMPDYRLPRKVFNYTTSKKEEFRKTKMRWFEQFVQPRNGSNGL